MGVNERPPVRVEIDELVFDGFDHRVDAGRVSAAFRAELVRLVERDGVPLADGGADRILDELAELPALPATTSPDRLGAALARSVHAALSGKGREPRPGRTGTAVTGR